MNIIDTILDKARKKADSAEVFFLTNESTAGSWNSDKLKMAETKETMGVALRVLIGGKLGFFSSSKLDDLDKVVNTACELALLGSEFKGQFPKTYKPVNVDFYDAPTAEMSIQKLIDCGNSVIGRVKEARNEAVFEAKLDRTVQHVEIANTWGAHAKYRKSIFSGFVYGTITKEGDVIGAYEFDESSIFENQQDRWVKVLIDKINHASKIVELPSGEYPCIVTPKAAGFFGPLKLAMSARALLKDMSPFKGKVGEKIFDDRVELIDDGLKAKMTSSQPIDDEGVTTQRTPLVEKGVLKGFIQDLHTSAIMGVPPTGNGSRTGLSSAPKAGYTTLCFTTGSKTLDQMVKGMEKGVIVDQIMGAHQASPFSGDFCVSVDLGFLVENGEIKGRFKDTMMSGNLFKMLKDQIVEIGSEPENTGLLIPPILYDKISIASGTSK